MGRLTVRGGGHLRGKIRVGGSKNAALPIIFASLLSGGVSKIENFPDITDTDAALKIIEQMGALITRSSGTVFIDCQNLKYAEIPEELVCSLRGSTYLIGACLSRFGRVKLSRFGGCNFSARPIDLHISAAESFGGVVEGEEIRAHGLHGCELHIAKQSVGATVNSLLLACGACGRTKIYGAACEPHVMTLIEFLRSMGVGITVGADVITVEPSQMRGGQIRIPGDMIEAGTYMALSLLCGADVYTDGFRAEELSSYFAALETGGFGFCAVGDGVCVRGRQRRKIDISAAPYPAFPTDLQPVCAPLLATGVGGTISDEVFPSRFSYLGELAKMGVEYRLSERGAVILPSKCTPARVKALDLRGGAACLLLALATEGESVIEDAQTLLRGYGNIVEKLQAVGADVEYEM